MMTSFRHRALLAALFMTFVAGAAVEMFAPRLAHAEEADDDSTPVVHHHSKSKHRHHTNAVYTRPQPASFIVDADTGTVLESENQDSERYPASLTKMMTLYLTFDALKKHTLSLDQMIPVSEHASEQPQTNISLQAGSHIAVKDLILSIVIRSANDSAVTLGEALGGGSESAFAEKMTRTAHALGMKNTIFRNASGLPNPEQHTTAHDMAVLGLALRKHFPQYFPFFKTESFSYQGKTYVTHNHVMTRYDGVDGIKTGYIRASGFNLVTSVTRNGHSLVAVVLGGPTWRARDDKMIALLDRTYTQIAAREGTKNIQLASNDHRKVMAFPAKVDTNDESQEGEGDLQGDDVKSSPSIAADWGIQVGSFARAREAQDATSGAVKQAPQELASAKIAVSDDKDGSANVHRARLVNLTQDQAEGACRKISAQHLPCFSYRAN